MDQERVVIRPVKESDLKSILEITRQVGSGFTSLPNNPDFMKKKIARSLESFVVRDLIISTRLFFFVMESFPQKEIVGTCAIDVEAGNSPPLHHYKLTNIIQESQKFKTYKKHKILELVNDYQNTSQLCTLFLKKAFRGQGRGEFLSRSRCLFISEFPQLFSDPIIAQMRGVVDDERGHSSFWRAIGKHFFNMSFWEADYHREVHGEHFIADLMPKYPIYQELLPGFAQDAIGKTHPETTPAMHLLEREGFQFRGYIDIFTGAPTIEIYKKDLKTAKESQKSKITGIHKLEESDPIKMISNTKLDFRVTLGKIKIINEDREAKIVIDEETAQALAVTVGDDIRYCDLHYQFTK